MDKKHLILTLLLFVEGFLFAYLFPNEILYSQKPQLQLNYSNAEYEISLKTRFLIDTIWKYEVKKPVIAGLIDTESSFIIHAVSSSNALGPFQMKPFLAQEIGILNPFNPYSEDRVYNLLNRYRNVFGTMDQALGAYHIGFYGTQKLVDSGKSPMADSRIKNYVNKNHEFQRLYNEGDRVTLKDYVWFDLNYGIGTQNRFSFTTIIPEFCVGSLALKTDYLSNDHLSWDNFNLAIYQDFAFFWFMNLYMGYDNGVVAGCTLKSNDWFDRMTLRYDFENQDLMWEAYNSFGMFFVSYGFSKNNIFFSPGLAINNKYHISLRVDYTDFKFLPGIECRINF